MCRIALALAVLLAACSGPSDSDIGTPDAGAPPTPEEACQAAAQAQCTKLGGCDAFGLQVRFGDEATCVARLKLGCLNALAVPDTSRTATSELACAAAEEAMTCEAFLAGETPAACLPTAGKRAAGAVCTHPAQCASAYCGISSGASCGTCMDAPGIGASCAVYACARDLVCAKDLCVRPALLNEPCDRNRPCDAGLACVGNLQQGGSGHCEALVTTAGAACDGKRQAASDCDRRQGLFCVGGQCVRATFATAGQACGAVNGAPVACLSGATCIIPDGAKQGTCVAPAADGAACDATSGPDCLPLARCVPTAGGSAGTCVMPDAKTCP